MSSLLAAVLFSTALGLALAPAVASAAQNKKQLGFLIFGTVFSQQGFALAGADIEIKPASAKKAKWKAKSDARGEFAFRVPPDSEYEVRVLAKGFAEQLHKVDARSGLRADLVIRLQPAAGGNSQ